MVLEASDTPGVLSSHLRADGSHAQSSTRRGTSAAARSRATTLKMDGGAVFKCGAVLEDSAREALAANNMEVSASRLHSTPANVRIISHVGRKLGIDEAKAS